MCEIPLQSHSVFKPITSFWSFDTASMIWLSFCNASPFRSTKACLKSSIDCLNVFMSSFSWSTASVKFAPTSCSHTQYHSYWSKLNKMPIQQVYLNPNYTKILFLIVFKNHYLFSHYEDWRQNIWSFTGQYIIKHFLCFTLRMQSLHISIMIVIFFDRDIFCTQLCILYTLSKNR